MNSESYEVPELPETDPKVGEIQWRRWEKSLTLSHIDGSCEMCDRSGPLMESHGKTFYFPPEEMVRTERSSINPKKSSRWVRVTPKPYWAYTHYAIRCPRCSHMKVWRKARNPKDWVEISYHSPRKVSPRGEDLERRGQQSLF